MPIMLLKELLRFYTDHGSNMFVCFLDASKASDRVDYSILFRKLITRKVPAYILHLQVLLYSVYNFIINK